MDKVLALLKSICVDERCCQMASTVHETSGVLV